MSLSKYHRWTNWIGTDESGKGDYFGSLVVAGVFVGEETCHDLRAIGVADSKKLSDQKIRAIAPQIFETHTNRVAWVELDPPAYNQRYESLRQNGQNLNDMLADLHARNSSINRCNSSTRIPNLSLAVRLSSERRVWGP